MSNEVIEHIKQINEESRKRMADNPNLFIGLLTEDPNHWEEYKTVEEFEVAMAKESFINVFKSYEGIKPRWEDFTHEDGTPMTSKEINKMTSDFIEREEKWAREEAEREEREERERKARVAKQARECTPTLGDVFGDVLRGAL
jgi:hypothetical protein